MASFNQDQVRHFREVFTQYSNEENGGITDRDNFAIAVSESLVQCSLGSAPDPSLLQVEFDRLVATSGVLTWQQFFQVLIHLNLNDGVGVRASAIIPEPSPPPDPVPPPRAQSLSQTRVQFSTSEPEPIAPEPMAPDPIGSVPENRSAFSSTIRRMGHAVGNFFGVTDESQHGASGRIGWEEFTERRVEENNSGLGLVGTLTRRASLSRRPSHRGVSYDDPPPPDYPSIADGRSFNLDDLGDSDSDEDAFITEAPPNYLDVIGPGGQAVGVPASDPWLPAPTGGVVRNSGFTGDDELGIFPQQEYPAATRPAEITVIDQAAPTLPPPRDELIFDKKEAWDYYQKFVKAEKKLRRRRVHDDALDFFGDATSSQSAVVDRERRGGSLRRDRLSSVDQPTDPSQVQRRKKKKKRTKLQRQSTLIRTEVESLPSFWPVCTILVTLAQVVGMIVLLPLFGIAPIDVFPQEVTTEFASLNITNPANFTYYRGVNLWIGPTATHLIQFGAKFTPCMRTDFGIRRRNARKYDGIVTGCCKNENSVGTVRSLDCGFFHSLSDNTTNTTVLNATGFEPGLQCSNNQSQFFPPNFHPCCISITGLCEVMDYRQCEARGGFYHTEADTCQEVNCFRDVCGFNEVGIGEERGSGLQPTAQQFWRWFTSIFLHLGVIHLVVYMPIQLYVGIKIERTIGWLRIAIIYILSGVGGNIVSAVFIPYGVNCGVGGAVFGLLGVLFVELFQFWQIVDRAWLELLKLTGFVVFLLALGTLPYIDNFAHLGGLLFGVPSAIVFVPYITFGKWDAARKRILLVICVPLLIALYLAGFFTFYFIPDPSFCFFCHYLNCVPYVPGFCPEEFNNPDPTIFGL